MAGNVSQYNTSLYYFLNQVQFKLAYCTVVVTVDECELLEQSEDILCLHTLAYYLCPISNWPIRSGDQPHSVIR